MGGKHKSKIASVVRGKKNTDRMLINILLEKSFLLINRPKHLMTHNTLNNGKIYRVWERTINHIVSGCHGLGKNEFS